MLTPDGRDASVDLIDKVQFELAWTGEIVDTVETKSTDPVLTDLAGGSTVALERVKNRNSIFVGNG